MHHGQLGWNMLLPCEACIALAFVPAESTSANSHAAVDPSGIIQGATTGSLHAVNSHAKQTNSASGLVSLASLEVPSQGSGGVPPPLPLSLFFRHRGGRRWSLSDPCEACLQLACEADLESFEVSPFLDWDCQLGFRSFSQTGGLALPCLCPSRGLKKRPT